MRFNKPKTKRSSSTHKNRAGGTAHKQSKHLAFLSILLTSFLKGKYYRSAGSEMQEIAEFVKQDPKFAAKAAIYARNEYGMRSVSHVVAAEIAHEVSGEEWAKFFFSKVIYRVDDMMEIIAYYLNKYGKPLPKNMRKGFRHAFNKFDNYQLRKYKKKNAEVSLIDVINLVHPKPTDKNEEALENLVKGTSKGAVTWETKMTQTDGDEEQKEQVWTELLENNRLGYFATLRNLRNIAQQAPEALDMALNVITDKERIEKTLVMPFRYTTAIGAIDELNSSVKSKIITALSEAMDKSLANVPELDGKTVILLDDSGSMMGQPIRVGSLFAAVLAKSNNADLVQFSRSARYKSIDQNDSVRSIQKSIMNSTEFGGTDFGCAFEVLDRKYDRIIILSDMQAWVRSMWGTETVESLYHKYCKKYDTNPLLYSWDLNGYGDMQFPEENVFCLVGWSDKVFDIMNMLENETGSLMKKVNNIELK
jgi:hypothetical protein